MSEDQVKKFVQFRLNQARVTLREADTLSREQLWHGVINRAYYVMFYSVSALVAYRGQEISKHTGVISFFDKEFIRNGIFDKRLSTMLHEAFDNRQSNDYADFAIVDPEQAEKVLASASVFLSEIERYLKEFIST